jgi:hypothetical protein
VPCGYGLPTAEDCAISHWCPVLDGRPEGVTGRVWRAPCPLCQCPRALEFSIKGKTLQWNTFCGQHGSKEQVRQPLRDLLKGCFPGRERGPRPLGRDDITQAVLSAMPPMSMKLALLEMCGMGTREALDKLGVRREHRSRVIAGRTNFGA